MLKLTHIVMSMRRIVWEDPPADGRSKHGHHAKIVAELKTHPGKWAKILTEASDAQANNIRRGTIKAYVPTGDFEVVARNPRVVDGRRRVDIYARYIGKVDAEEHG